MSLVGKDSSVVQDGWTVSAGRPCRIRPSPRGVHADPHPVDLLEAVRAVEGEREGQWAAGEVAADVRDERHGVRSGPGHIADLAVDPAVVLAAPGAKFAVPTIGMAVVGDL